MKVLTLTLIGALFVICVPLLLITTNARFTANDIRLYEYDFDHFPVHVGTGLSKDEFIDIADDIITYFNSDQEYLDIGILNQREIDHMKDVKGLMHLTYNLQWAALSFIVVYIVAGFALRRQAFWRILARRLLQGCAATVAVLAVLGLWALISFDSLFLVFHKVSFSNNLWKLATEDSLVLMFPEEFFNDAALFIALVTLGEALLIAGVTFILRRVVRSRQSEEVIFVQSEWTKEE